MGAISQFAFLIGHFQCEARIEVSAGDWQTFPATWQGRYILEGHAIADEYRMTVPAGKLIVLGTNIRAYDPARQIWNIKWLDALVGTWTDLGPEELGGVIIDAQSITYSLKEPMTGHGFTRATYTNISPSHFTWRGEKSDDNKSWTAFMIVECRRTGNAA